MRYVLAILVLLLLTLPTWADLPIVTALPDGTYPGQGPCPQADAQAQAALDAKQTARQKRKTNICAFITTGGIGGDGATTVAVLQRGGRELFTASPLLSDLDLLVLKDEKWVDPKDGKTKPVITGKDRFWAGVGIAAVVTLPIIGVGINKGIEAIRVGGEVRKMNERHPEFTAAAALVAPLWNGIQLKNAAH